MEALKDSILPIRQSCLPCSPEARVLDMCQVNNRVDLLPSSTTSIVLFRCNLTELRCVICHSSQAWRGAHKRASVDLASGERGIFESSKRSAAGLIVNRGGVGVKDSGAEVVPGFATLSFWGSAAFVPFLPLSRDCKRQQYNPHATYVYRTAIVSRSFPATMPICQSTVPLSEMWETANLHLDSLECARWRQLLMPPP